MDAVRILMDLRLWIIAAIILSFTIPDLDIPYSTLIIVVLMIQMTLSMDGLKLSFSEFKDNRRGRILSILLCYVLNTSVTLLFGAIFIGEHDDIWYGWVMLASMPCAIAVVTAAILMDERLETAVLAVTATYLAGIILTPVLSFMLIGDAVSPLQILKYLLLFIFIPVILSRFTPYLRLKRTVKVPIINLMMAVMVFLSVNSNRGTITDDPALMAIIFGIVVLRVLVLNAIMWMIVRRDEFRGDRKGIYLVLGVWKNTGLSVSMSMVLLADTPSAVIPCFMCMIVETVWFSLITRKRFGDAAEPVPETV